MCQPGGGIALVYGGHRCQRADRPRRRLRSCSPDSGDLPATECRASRDPPIPLVIKVASRHFVPSGPTSPAGSAVRPKSIRLRRERPPTTTSLVDASVKPSRRRPSACANRRGSNWRWGLSANTREIATRLLFGSDQTPFQSAPSAVTWNCSNSCRRFSGVFGIGVPPTRAYDVSHCSARGLTFHRNGCPVGDASRSVMGRFYLPSLQFPQNLSLSCLRIGVFDLTSWSSPKGELARAAPLPQHGRSARAQEGGATPCRLTPDRVGLAPRVKPVG